MKSLENVNSTEPVVVDPNEPTPIFDTVGTTEYTPIYDLVARHLDGVQEQNKSAKLQLLEFIGNTSIFNPTIQAKLTGGIFPSEFYTPIISTVRPTKKSKSSTLNLHNNFAKKGLDKSINTRDKSIDITDPINVVSKYKK